MALSLTLSREYVRSRLPNPSGGGKPTIEKVGYPLFSVRSSGDGDGFLFHHVPDLASSGRLVLTRGTFALWPAGSIGGGPLITVTKAACHGFEYINDVGLAGQIDDGGRRVDSGASCCLLLLSMSIESRVDLDLVLMEPSDGGGGPAGQDDQSQIECCGGDTIARCYAGIATDRLETRFVLFSLGPKPPILGGGFRVWDLDAAMFWSGCKKGFKEDGGAAGGSGGGVVMEKVSAWGVLSNCGWAWAFSWALASISARVWVAFVFFVFNLILVDEEFAPSSTSNV